MPPLREHTGDIPALIVHFAQALAPKLGVALLEVPEPALHALMADYDWPGNIRELRNWVERSLILGEFRCDFLPAAPAPKAAAEGLSLDELEKRHILATLDACGGNKSLAAQRLGVSRKTLDRRCAEWGR